MSQSATQDQARLEGVVERVVERYGEAESATVAANLRGWLSEGTPMLDLAEALAIVDRLDPGVVYDEFWRVLPFGTGGRRGSVGIGPNRMNPSTVAMTIQGHAQFLTEQAGDGEVSVVVANDVRTFYDLAGRYEGIRPNGLLGMSSGSMARLAAEIYAGNGIVAYLAAIESESAVLTTPELSYAIRRLHAQGGVNFSASHNHPDDNGIKIYDHRGGQPVPPHDEQLLEVMQDVASVRSVPLEEAIAAGTVRPIPDEVHDGYLALYRDDAGVQPEGSPPVVFTPLGGSGDSTVGDVLRARGFDVRIPPGQAPEGEVDGEPYERGSFEHVPYRAPNPEVPEATAPSRGFADEIGAGIVFASDPDADRLGVDVRLADGSWKHLTGNQIASVLAYYLMADEAGPRLSGVVFTTGVTTRLITAIADQAGCRVKDDLLVGFKYIADELARLEAPDSGGSPDDFVLGAEESHGVLVTAEMRDKDATSGVAHLATLHARLAAGRDDLFSYYLRILERFGGYAEKARSVVLGGEAGVRNIDRIMAAFRERPTAELPGCGALQQAVDHQDEERFGTFVSGTDRIARNVLALHYETAIITLRPSGTEPKLKWYVHVAPRDGSEGKSGDELFREADEAALGVATAFYREVLARIDVELSAAALELPDIVALEQKVRFDEEIAPWIRERLTSPPSAGSPREELARLAARLTPGADPMPALARALAVLAEDADPARLNRETLAALTSA